jgi:hypothetical protein
MVPWSLSIVVISACGPAGPSDGGPANTNLPPIAAFHAARSALAGLPVELDGTQTSDPNGDPVVYEWSFDHVPVGSRVTAASIPENGTRTARAAFVPDKLGTYVVALSASDGRGAVAATIYETVEVREDALPAAANVGPDLVGLVGDEFVLDGGSAVDGLGRPLTFTWTLQAAPEGSAAVLVGTDGVAPSFVADLAGFYEVTLVVDNGTTSSPPDAVDVLVSNQNDAPPVASIADDGITIEDCSDVGLDGTDSYDPDGNALTYFWSIQQAPEGAAGQLFDDVWSAKPTFTPNVAGTYVVSLSVFDDATWAITEATFHAIDRPTNTPPVVSAGADKPIDAGTVTCDRDFKGNWSCDACPDMTTMVGQTAAVTDADDDDVALSWRVVAGEADLTTNTHALKVEALLEGIRPEEPECVSVDYEFALEGTDCPGATVEDSLVVTVTCCGEEK